MVRKINNDDVENPGVLVWKVFEEFEAPEYSDKGIQEFKQYISPDTVNIYVRLF